MSDTQKLELRQQRMHLHILGAEVLLKVSAGIEPFRIQIRFKGEDEVTELRFTEDGEFSGVGTKFMKASLHVV